MRPTLQLFFSLENALVKLDAEKKRMDDLNTRDEANETKFASLQKTLDMLVNGETKKTMDSKHVHTRRNLMFLIVLLYHFLSIIS